MNRIALVALVLFLAAAAASAATYYVRTDGNDSNDGLADDAAHAWLTIAYAFATAADTDTVYIRAGTYAETVDMLISGKSLTVIPQGGAVIVDASALPATTYVLGLVNSGTVIQGDATNYLQIGIDGSAGSGGAAHSVWVRGSVSASVYAKLYYVRVYATAGASQNAFVVDTNVDAAHGRALFDHCLAEDVGANDGFSAGGGTGTYSVYLDMVSCTADACAQDGFTSHYKSVVTTTGCTAKNCDTGFTPAYATTSWISTNDTLTDNNKTARKSNLYFIGGANFQATGLTLSGTTTYHIRVAQNYAGTTTANISGATVSGTATSWIRLYQLTSAAGAFTLNLYGCSFGGTVTGNGMDDDVASTDATNVYAESSSFVRNTTTVWVLASRATKNTTWKFVNCRLENQNAGGNGCYLQDAAGDVQLKNCIIVAGATSGMGVNDVAGGGAGYTTGCGHNRVTAKTAFGGDAAAQAGDVAAAAQVDAWRVPLPRGNADLGRGDPAAGIPLGGLDLYGRPRLRADAAPIGPVWPQRSAAEAVLVPLIQIGPYEIGH